jgi:NDP-sugar pyrophosphorylase family protein
LQRVAPYLAAKKPADAPGHFIADLLQHEPVYAFPTTGGRFDIGSLADYLDADRTLRREPLLCDTAFPGRET